MSVVLRVDGLAVDVEACREWLPSEALEGAWRAGERARSGALRANSGFNVLLSDAEGRDAVPEAVRAFLSIAHHIDDLVLAGADASIDFALFVYAHRPTSVAIEPELLRQISRHRVALVISAYPCADDGDDE